jgi:hypothetical protein
MKNVGDRNNFASVETNNVFHTISYNDSDMNRSHCESSLAQDVSYSHAKTQTVNETAWKGITYDTIKPKSFSENNSFQTVNETQTTGALPLVNRFPTSLSTHTQHGLAYDCNNQKAAQNEFTSSHTGSTSAPEISSNDNIKETPHFINFSQVNEHKTASPSMLQERNAASQAQGNYFASFPTENSFVSAIYKTKANDALDSSKSAYRAFISQNKNLRFSNIVQHPTSPQTYQNTPCSWKSLPQNTYTSSVSPGNPYLRSFPFAKGYSGSLSPGNTYSTVESPNRLYSSCTETEKYASKPVYQTHFAAPELASPKSHQTISYANNLGFSTTPVSYEYNPCTNTTNIIKKHVMGKLADYS